MRFDCLPSRRQDLARSSWLKFFLSRDALTCLLLACIFFAADASFVGARAGLLDELFGVGDAYRPSAPPAYGYSPDAYQMRAAPRRDRAISQKRMRVEPRLSGSVTSESGRAHKSRPLVASLESSGSRAEAGRFVCVRLCDGAVVSLAKRADGAAQMRTCDNACPGASTRLFTLPVADDDMSKAMDENDLSYAVLMARIKEKSAAKTCSCAATARQDVRVDDFFEDATLRNGDVVATAEGLQVFHGVRRTPHKPDEFLALDEARDLSKGSRGALFAIDQKLKTKPAH